MEKTIQDADQLFQAAADGGWDRLVLESGNYYLPEPVLFRERRGIALIGKAGARLVGGFPLSARWEAMGDQRFRTPLSCKELVDGLVVGGRAFRMARYPHWDPEAVMGGTAADCLEFAGRCESPDTGYLHAMHSHMWGSMHYRIRKDMADGIPALEGGWQNNRPMGNHPDYRYVENLREALGADGEFYHDREEGMLYVCSNREPSSSLEVITNPYLLRFESCEEVTLRGLTFANTARTFLAGYDRLLRSDWCIHRGGAVMFHIGREIAVHGCEFAGCGSNALFFNGNVADAAVTSCHFHDLDAGAICFVGLPDSVRDSSCDLAAHTVGDREGVGPASPNHPRDCRVEDCLIHHIGRVEKQVAGVEISMAARITIRSCTICQCPRAAVNVCEGTFGGHVIEYCKLFDTVLESGDHGSFNGWGRDRFWRAEGIPDRERKALALRDAVEPTFLRHNLVRCDHGWDIDLDDGCSNYVLEGNVCLNGGIKLREGYCRRVRDNICVNNSIHVHVWFDGSGDIIEHNIVTAPYQPVGMPEAWGARVDENIHHVPGMEGTAPASALALLSRQDKNSLAMDAGITASSWLVTNPEAARLGFAQPPVSGWGVRTRRLRDLEPPIPLPEAIRPFLHGAGALFDLGGIIAKDMETDGEMSAYGTAGHRGCILLQVPEFHPLRGLGMEAGQLVEAVNGREVRNCRELQERLGELAGQEFELTLRTMNQRPFVLKAGRAEAPERQYDGE